MGFEQWAKVLIKRVSFVRVLYGTSVLKLLR